MPPPETARRYAGYSAPAPEQAGGPVAQPAAPAAAGADAVWQPTPVAPLRGDPAAHETGPQEPAALRQQGMGNAALVAANDTGAMPAPAAVPAGTTEAQGERRGAGEEGPPGEAGAAAGGEQAAADAAGGGAPPPEHESAPEPEPAADTAASESEAIRILGRALPSQSVSALTTARGSAEGEIARERQDLADNPPTREAPSGLRPGEGLRAEGEAGGGAGGEQAPSIDEQQGEGQEPPPPDTGHEPASAPVETGPSPDAIVDSAPEDPVARIEIFRRQLWATPASDDVDTSAGERPTVALTQEADPGRYDEQATENETALAGERTAANAAMRVDEGVNDVYPTLPDEMLTAEFEAGETSLPEIPAEPMAELSPDLRRGFDEGASAKWSAEIGGHAAGHEQAMLDRRSAETAARADTERQIAEAEGLTVEDQLAARNAAHDEVALARADWRGELDDARATYDGENTRVRGNLQRDVGARVLQANTEADNHLREGERQAQAEQARVEGEAERRKAEAERRRQEADGFFDWIASRVRSFFDALKRGLKMLFDGLRAAVRFLIEGAKKLANAAIELGRRAVVGLIRAAGAALELACDVFLAAFPEARDRAKERIRAGVATAEQAVNDAAAWLRDRVNRLLDALGAALIFIIDLYETFYTAVLEAVETLVAGMVELARGLYRLGLAAEYSPGEFMGQVQEELIGADLTQPLPFELTEAERAQLEAQANEAVPEGGPLPDPADFGGDPAMAAAALPPTITADQVEVDPVAEFVPEPDLLASLDWRRGDVIEFGENNAPENTLAGWQADMMGEAPETEPAADGLPAPAVEPGNEPAAAEAERPATTEERLQEMIDAPPEHTCQTEKPTEQQGPPIPLEAKFGPLTVGQRARYLMAKAWQGIQQWFRCNWEWVVLGVIAVIAVIAAIVVASVLSGGTVLGALGAIFSVVGPVLAGAMIGVAIYRALGFIGDWVSKSWDGDIIGGAKGLARAVAVGAVEIIFAVLTYITGGVFRAIAATVKGAGRVAAAAARGTARLVGRGMRAAGRGLRRGGAALLRGARRVNPRATRMVMRGGRIVVRGVRGGIGRGARSLRDLGRQLGQRFRFRKFKIVRRGRWFQIYGLINPWVLLANGELTRVEGLPDKRIGDLVEVAGKRQKGIVVSIQTQRRNPLTHQMEDFFPGSAAAAGSTKSARRRFHQANRGKKPEEIRDLLNVGAETSRNSRQLAANMKSTPRSGRPPHQPGDHAHHLVPSTDPRGAEAQAILKKFGIGINSPENGIFLKSSIHAKVHTNAGYVEINNLLRGATSRTDAVAVLDQLAKRIAAGKFP